ncbi:MAG TPA: DinB family protein [Candidatus Limnocylindrales bacterium]|nr:DinB family protein [Candidatus Limnocylindrales bacterium]
MKTEDVDQLRRQLVEMLDARGAHMPFEPAVADFPAEALNRVVPNGVYTPWHLLEHIRFAQADILDYIRNRSYLAPTWPDNYWPPRDAQATPDDLAATVEAFRRDRAALREVVSDPATDLFAVIPGTPGHTILREIRVVGAHNAYHLGEFAILRQAMGTWPAGREGP